MARAGGGRRRVEAREPRALTVLLERLLPAVGRWAHGRLPQRARRRLDTGDLVQEAAYGALTHLGDDDALDSLGVETYLRQSIRHRIIDEIRRAGRGETGDELAGELAFDSAPSPLDDSIESEERRRFRAALATLEEDDRMLIVGRVDLEFNYAELATTTGRPSPDAARVALGRAMSRLARMLGGVH